MSKRRRTCSLKVDLLCCFRQAIFSPRDLLHSFLKMAKLFAIKNVVVLYSNLADQLGIPPSLARTQHSQNFGIDVLVKKTGYKVSKILSIADEKSSRALTRRRKRYRNVVSGVKSDVQLWELTSLKQAA